MLLGLRLFEVAENMRPVGDGNRGVGNLLPEDATVGAEKMGLDSRKRKAPRGNGSAPDHRTHSPRAAARAGLFEHKGRRAHRNVAFRHSPRSPWTDLLELSHRAPRLLPRIALCPDRRRPSGAWNRPSGAWNRQIHRRRLIRGPRARRQDLPDRPRPSHFGDNGSVRSPAQVLAEWFVRHITRPRREYRRFVFNDAEKLKSRIRPGDVVLIDGDQRVSQVVKYLTMSSWSHSAIYIGSALTRDSTRRAEVKRVFDGEARYLIAEALIDEGVVISPLVKYIDFNIRVCRPVGLTREQIQSVVGYVLGRVGHRYDRRNIFDLFRYLLPLHLIPMRLREDALHFGSGKDTETICSSLLAEAFAQVGFEILPIHIRRNAIVRGRLRQWIFGRPTRHVRSGVLGARHSSLCVPEDFDLSPHFDIVKFNSRDPIRFPYQRQE